MQGGLGNAVGLGNVAAGPPSLSGCAPFRREAVTRRADVPWGCEGGRPGLPQPSQGERPGPWGLGEGAAPGASGGRTQPAGAPEPLQPSPWQPFLPSWVPVGKHKGSLSRSRPACRTTSGISFCSTKRSRPPSGPGRWGFPMPGTHRGSWSVFQATWGRKALPAQAFADSQHPTVCERWPHPGDRRAWWVVWALTDALRGPGSSAHCSLA